ncbi:hypothetical protein E0485_23080 [Paenibacillus albiflavus]|uniref:Uncharacterized protein n=1 Tax=Paenibacillus albiflavus TaxID=2545760 RepID=A0A4R4E2M4_9BACL|nr:hypothetical protein [Paenibacillus albiflavus]TCZ70974.1 hypothetical protein E0485_23080 [Paenibacillus albiflavus]
MKLVDKALLIDHLAVCIQLADRQQQEHVAAVLQNLKKEVSTGEFDTEFVSIAAKGGNDYV